MAPITDERLASLHALIADGEIVIFTKRDADTLLKLAGYFDHGDDTNFETLREIILAWRTLSSLGALGRAVASLLVVGVGLMAGLAAISGKIPVINDIMHWGGGSAPGSVGK